MMLLNCGGVCCPANNSGDIAVHNLIVSTPHDHLIVTLNPVNMSSPDQTPSRASQSNNSAAGPYGPRNTLNASQEPSFATNENGPLNTPKFGSTTPMKSNMAGVPYWNPQDLARAERKYFEPVFGLASPTACCIVSLKPIGSD